MNGLELLKQLHIRYPTIFSIILSNYNEFDYVRSALKQGTVDYWLKHELNTANIAASLEQVIQHLPEKAAENLKLSKNELREKFAANLLTQYPFSEDKLKLDEVLFDFPVSYALLLPVILTVNFSEASDGITHLDDALIQEFSVKNIISELLTSFSFPSVIVKITAFRYCILFSCIKKEHDATFQRKIQEALILIKNKLLKFLNMKVVFTPGDVCNHYKSLPQMYKRIEYKAQSQLIFNDVSGSSKEKAQKTLHFHGLTYELENKLSVALKTADKTAIKENLHTIFQYIICENLSLQESQLIFSDLHKILTLTCKIHHIVYENVSPSHIQLNRLFSSVCDYEAIKFQFYSSFYEVADYLQKPKELSKSHYIKLALNIIQERYTENISLNEIAEEIHISSGYLSTLFKQETSMGFTEYINRLRIKKALILLKETTLTIYDIASRCGYNNYEYFFKVFKKYTGKTPSAYINSSLL